jgi:hypothetical protein
MCHRFRMRFGNAGEDFASRVWDAGYVGIWYGSWLPEDWMAASEVCKAEGTSTPLAVKEKIESFGRSISGDGVHVAKRFDDLPQGAWVFTVFNRSIHLAQLGDQRDLFELLPQFANEGETFKARRVTNKKEFPLDQLPPSFLLLPQAGRSDVHQVQSCSTILQLLVEHQTAADVCVAFDALDWDTWLSALGPEGWETLCFGYLIQEYGLLPTGLSVGQTLADFDIVGSLRSGERVYAQCKGTPEVHVFSEREKAAFSPTPGIGKFFFARRGVAERMPSVEHLDQQDLVRWLNTTDTGMEYRHLLRPSFRARS